MANDSLGSWNDREARRAIQDFATRVTTPGSPHFVPPEARIAVFDNDGTLWCEKPLPIELIFILQRLAEMTEKDTGLRERQPWKAAYERDYAWLGSAITRHYHGDDSDVRLLIGAILQAFEGLTVEAYEAAADRFLHTTKHPTLGRHLCECAYRPMVELLGYLEANGFTTFIASAGDRDFMRPVTQEIYGIPPERVIGSSNALRYTEGEDGGSVAYCAEPDVFDDGPTKPVRIWSRIGRRPIFAAGNSNGDLPMLRYCARPDHSYINLLLEHDDGEREFAYQAGAEASIEQARKCGWNVVSIKNDWKTVFAARQ